MPRSEPAAAASVATALDLLAVSAVLDLVRHHCDSAWLERALMYAPRVEDEGLYWVVLPGDEEIWPLRVLVVGHEGERHAVWVTYRWPVGSGVWVQTQEGEPLLVPQQAGELGRLALLGGFTPAGA